MMMRKICASEEKKPLKTKKKLPKEVKLEVVFRFTVIDCL
jgi:hypothetical protein